MTIAGRYTWDDFSDMFSDAIGMETLGMKNVWRCLTSGQRRVSQLIDLPELDYQDLQLHTVASRDWVELPGNISFVYNVFDLETGTPLSKEESVRNRDIYKEKDTGRPPNGDLYKWLHQGTKLYLRDTPDSARELRLTVKLVAPVLSEETDRNEVPITPPQFDDALLNFALGHYYATYSRDQNAVQMAGAQDNAGRQQIGMEPEPKQEENKSRVSRFYLQGYRMTPMGR